MSEEGDRPIVITAVDPSFGKWQARGHLDPFVPYACVNVSHGPNNAMQSAARYLKTKVVARASRQLSHSLGWWALIIACRSCGWLAAGEPVHWGGR